MIFIAGFFLCILEVQAKEPNVDNGHQNTPIGQALQLLEEYSAFWKELETESGYERARGCVVHIHMGTSYGSGVIWSVGKESAVVASNAHLLEVAEKGNVTFSNGTVGEGTVIGLSEMRDIGFMEVELSGLAKEERESLRMVGKDKAPYEKLVPGEALFVIGSASGVAADYYEGTVGNRAVYFSNFGANMLYGYCQATAGMSGGGTFDEEGRFIGMLTAGTEQGEIVSLPVETMVEEYEKILGLRE